ncbi:prepilin-type N-terminal cleavage/methylation domain-containing protein [Wenzhouxiangella sp. AB-CW3]|uniref:type IV pilus modification PilV family protein n=1 Tax=Wenzhouxiangella sp. AB-CW3 TaxID=2771012 RepID=UPI00168BAE74|nr:prepilin-type N-terminal cleavage/methylation domain-containing protein [Wenzhouxiangella sp. AB-CW3]QOC23044.1 prepilin-type N-terminal cleavage/methylation domain-containing protein [Wenzhouxiangella sp. AB-CW3]
MIPYSDTARRLPSGAPGRPHRQGGFTLIEVMAAFMVFALLFGVLLQILSTSVSNTRLAGDYTRAALWAQSRLDMLGLEEMLEPGTTQGQFDDEFRWTMEVREELVIDDRGLDPLDMPVSLYHVTLTVEWGETRRREAVFETLRSVDTHWEERQLAGPR